MNKLQIYISSIKDKYSEFNSSSDKKQNWTKPFVNNVVTGIGIGSTLEYAGNHLIPSKLKQAIHRKPILKKLFSNNTKTLIRGAVAYKVGESLIKELDKSLKNKNKNKRKS